MIGVGIGVVVLLIIVVIGVCLTRNKSLDPGEVTEEQEQRWFSSGAAIASRLMMM